MGNVTIIKPSLKHAQGIKDLIDFYSQRRIVLPRSIADIYEKIRIFWVAVDEEGTVVGCVGLQFCWNDLAEIKSLAVREDYHGKGIGRTLVEYCLAEAREFGARKVFALTYVSDFFKNLGFVSISKDDLPHKVWSECINCQHFPNCDEEAVEMILS
ncbi:MAG: N-acetyltransferase [Candidatus Auribacterota bacterium]|jgi:amino-acid N-acetyltransferase|uniref:N-acetyltransferase n=1 Tax=Candidatus Auribacter fodinae TaxID=2093366 RepID=A0A3A4R050_9BACT|nr:MAG: N-acetyltransferase [Candidatus Auribacter fodinae]